METRENSDSDSLNKTGRSHAKWSQEALVVKRLESEAIIEKSIPQKANKKNCSDRQKKDRPKKRLESEAVMEENMPQKVNKKSRSEHCRGKKKSRLTNTSDMEPCNLCGRLYDDPEFDSFPWGQCMKCMKWYHDICDDTCYVTGICKLCKNSI